ncbi:MAG: serine/threonine-protein kinase [Kofleriaceae bacterium]
MSRALGRYELLRPIARGGMAEVFLARRRAAGVEKWLVVKRIRPERATDARFLELFVREARLSMSLAHQNIVPVFDFGRIDDQVFIAMERVEGKDLGSTLQKSAPVPPLIAAFIAAECCQALDYAHLRKGPDGTALGIVHRDVTPRNVMLSWAGEVKLTDFGIAALATDAKGSVIGTPGYMAPEQARNEAVDPRADVYAVGLVLREALTGDKARANAEREATLAQARSGELPAWTFEGPLRAIVDKATAADPAARYANASEMAAALDDYLVAERAATKAEAPARLLARWLASVWGEEREETGIDEAIEGSAFESFLDDGVVGTGTERSMMATAADEEVPKPVEVTPPPVVEKRGNRVMIGVALVAAAALVFAVWPRSKPTVIVPKADARVADAMVVVDAQVMIVEPIDAPVMIVDAGVVHDARPRRPVIDAGALIAPPPRAVHKVMVNATPWAYVTVDNDPTRYETLATLHLTAGPHTFHFEHEATKKDKQIVVPDDDSLVITESMR